MGVRICAERARPIEDLAGRADLGFAIKILVAMDLLKGGKMLESETGGVELEFLAIEGVAFLGQSELSFRDGKTLGLECFGLLADDPTAEFAETMGVKRRGGEQESAGVRAALGNGEKLRSGRRFNAGRIGGGFALPGSPVADVKGMKGTEVRLHTETIRRGSGKELFGFRKTERNDPIVKLGLLVAGELEESAIGTRFHNQIKVSAKLKVRRTELNLRACAPQELDARHVARVKALSCQRTPKGYPSPSQIA